jgi:hypothetical protein
MTCELITEVLTSYQYSVRIYFLLVLAHHVLYFSMCSTNYQRLYIVQYSTTVLIDFTTVLINRNLADDPENLIDDAGGAGNAGDANAGVAMAAGPLLHPLPLLPAGVRLAPRVSPLHGRGGAQRSGKHSQPIETPLSVRPANGRSQTFWTSQWHAAASFSFQAMTTN